jgi:hypothetical protein
VRALHDAVSEWGACLAIVGVIVYSIARRAPDGAPDAVLVGSAVAFLVGATLVLAGVFTGDRSAEDRRKGNSR